MVRQYLQVTDEMRKELVRLIHQESYTIARASKATQIPYDNAKAINRTFLRESRTKKVNYQQRYLNSKARKERLLRLAQSAAATDPNNQEVLTQAQQQQSAAAQDQCQAMMSSSIGRSNKRPQRRHKRHSDDDDEYERAADVSLTSSSQEEDEIIPENTEEIPLAEEDSFNSSGNDQKHVYVDQNQKNKEDHQERCNMSSAEKQPRTMLMDAMQVGGATEENTEIGSHLTYSQQHKLVARDDEESKDDATTKKSKNEISFYQKPIFIDTKSPASHKQSLQLSQAHTMAVSHEEGEQNTLFRDCARRPTNQSDRVMFSASNYGSEDKKRQLWRLGDIYTTNNQTHQNPANDVAESDKIFSGLPAGNSISNDKININRAFKQASGAMNMGDLPFKKRLAMASKDRAADGDDDNSPLPADEKSNRSAPAARLYQENFQSSFNAATMAMQNHTSHSESNQSQHSGLQSKPAAQLQQQSPCTMSEQLEEKERPQSESSSIAPAKKQQTAASSLPQRTLRPGCQSAFKRHVKTKDSQQQKAKILLMNKLLSSSGGGSCGKAVQQSPQLQTTPLADKFLHQLSCSSVKSSPIVFPGASQHHRYIRLQQSGPNLVRPRPFFNNLAKPLPLFAHGGGGSSSNLFQHYLSAQLNQHQSSTTTSQCFYTSPQPQPIATTSTFLRSNTFDGTFGGAVPEPRLPVHQNAHGGGYLSSRIQFEQRPNQHYSMRSGSDLLPFNNNAAVELQKQKIRSALLLHQGSASPFSNGLNSTFASKNQQHLDSRQHFQNK